MVGSIFTISSIQSWYNQLTLPALRPPNFLFGPVWVTLYTLIGISFYWIWIKGTKKKNVKEALQIFFVQLILNATWSIIFFGLHQVFLGFVNIVILWIAIIIVIKKFYRVEKKAGYILLPYLLWVSLATYLNYTIWVLNK